MDGKDIRWEQRFANFETALAKLGEVAESDTIQLSELETEGLTQRFEYTYELAWKTLQDLLRSKGYFDIAGPIQYLHKRYKTDTSRRGWVETYEKGARTNVSHVRQRGCQGNSKCCYPVLLRLIKATGYAIGRRSFWYATSLVRMTHDLADETIQQMRRVFSRHPAIERVIMFGSRAMHTHRTGSDIDLAILGSSLSQDELLDLQVGLDDLGFLYEVDVKDLRKIRNLELADHIRRVGDVIYEAGND